MNFTLNHRSVGFSINNQNFNIHEFRNYNDRVLQIISTNNISGLIRNVDFVCCGLGMDCNGNITEYLDGAYDDCINNRLRINTKNSNPQILINNYKQRLSKLVQRGWKPYNISKDKKIIYKKLYLQTKKNKQKEKVLNLKHSKKKLTSPYQINLKVKKMKKILYDTDIFDKFKNEYLTINTTNTCVAANTASTTSTANTYFTY